MAKYSTNLGHIDIGKLKKFNSNFQRRKTNRAVQYLDKLETKKGIDERVMMNNLMNKF